MNAFTELFVPLRDVRDFTILTEGETFGKSVGCNSQRARVKSDAKWHKTETSLMLEREKAIL